jgi:hypothetical protein
MAIQEFQYRPGTFQAVQYTGSNLEEIISLVGVGNAHTGGEPALRVRLDADTWQDVKTGWWVSVRDGDVCVSSGTVKETDWLPVGQKDEAPA